MNEPSVRGAIVSRIAEGPVWHVLGDCIRCHVHGRQTGGAYSIVELSPPRGVGAPPHIHHREAETFFVIEGVLEMRCGDKTISAGAGDVVALPKGVPHAFKNVGPGNARVLVMLVPAGFEGFFEEVDRLSAADAPDMREVVKIGRRYGLEFV